MSSKFGQMRPLVFMATDRVTVGKRRHHVFSNVFDQLRSYLQATMIDIRARMNSKFGEIGPWTTELTPLEHLKKIQLILEKMTSHFLAIFHLILFILTGNGYTHKSLDEFEIRPDPTTAGFSWQQIVI